MKIIKLCEEISQLCNMANEHQWESLFEYFIKNIKAGHLDTAKKEIRTIYGGMGSFNDLILQKDGVPLSLNEKLDTLRVKLYEEVSI